jgi:hypothetical protein
MYSFDTYSSDDDKETVAIIHTASARGTGHNTRTFSQLKNVALSWRESQVHR